MNAQQFPQGELWAMEPRRLQAHIAEVGKLAQYITAEKPAEAAASPEPSPQIDPSGVATIPITGVMMKEIPWYYEALGMAATSTAAAEAQIKALDEDESVKAIVLDIESPGGSIAGVERLAAAISGAKKPVYAHGSEIMASAAYWVASQADKISANKTTEVGSVGVYRVIVDSSEAAEKAGLKVHVIRSGEHKGAAIDGAPISEAQLKEEKRLIDQAADMFSSTVAAGRNLPIEQVEYMATGSTWFGNDAQDLKLIDSVESIETTKRAAAEEALNQGKSKKMTIEHVPEAPPAADSNSQELDALRAELAAIKEQAQAEAAKAEALNAALTAQAEAAKSQAINAAVASGQIAPAMLPSVEKLAASTDVDGLNEFISGLPVQTRKDEAGTAEAKPQSAAAEQGQLSRAFDIGQEWINAAGRVKAISADGRAILHDGSKVTFAELNGEF